MDLAIGPIGAGVAPMRNLQRTAVEQPQAVERQRESITRRAVDPSSDPAAYSLAVSVSLSPAAMLALQNFQPPGTETSDQAQAAHEAADETAGGHGRGPADQGDLAQAGEDAGRSPPEPTGADPARADLIGARTAYRMAAAAARTARSEIQPGVDLAA